MTNNGVTHDIVHGAEEERWTSELDKHQKDNDEEDEARNEAQQQQKETSKHETQEDA